jgi:DNA polymerase-3 subunit alpha
MEVEIAKKQDLKGILFFDCETTGIPARGAKWDVDFMQFPYIVQLAWVIDDKERSYIVKPEGWEIPDEVVAIHGITTEIALTEGVPFSEIIDEFIEDAACSEFIVAHNIHFDTSLIKANILRSVGREYYDSKVEDALYKGKRIDTMMKTIRFVNAKYPDGRAGKFPKLEELFEKLFPGETFRAHDALEDVKALVRCLPELIRLGIIEMKVKEYKD